MVIRLSSAAGAESVAAGAAAGAAGAGAAATGITGWPPRTNGIPSVKATLPTVDSPGRFLPEPVLTPCSGSADPAASRL